MQQDQQANEEALAQRLAHKAIARMRKKHRPMRVSGKSVFTLKKMVLGLTKNKK